MRETIVASRYAKSLLGLAAEHKAESQVYEDMKVVALVCKESRDLMLLLKSPIVKTEKKIAVLDEIFKERLNKLSYGFMHIIAKNRREGLLHEMAVEYQNRYKKKNGIVTATVTTATGLDEATRSAVLKLVQDSAKSEVELVERLDGDLIGGLVLRIGDIQYDGSLQRRLRDLKQEFTKGTYLSN